MSLGSPVLLTVIAMRLGWQVTPKVISPPWLQVLLGSATSQLSELTSKDAFQLPLARLPKRVDT
jgi:hypothetical protein